MRRTIGPFLVTAVVLIGGAAVVANPIVPPPADIRVSASDLAADGSGIDVLDPGFLEYFGAGQQGWQNSVDTLETLFSGLVNRGAEISLEALAISLADVIRVDPTLVLGVLAATPIDDLPITPSTPDVAENAVKVLRAIADISSSFGTAGVTFIQQVGMMPAVINELAQQVAAGTLTPVEALLRLVAAPLSAALTGHPELTGNPEIDAVFKTGALRPVIAALVKNVPGLLGQEDAAIDTIADGATGAATDLRSTIDPSAQQSPTSTSAENADSDEQLKVATENPPPPPTNEGEAEDAGEADGEILVGGTTAPSRSNRPPRIKPGGIAKEISDRLNKTISDIDKTVKKLTGGDKPTPGNNTESADDNKADDSKDDK